MEDYLNQFAQSLGTNLMQVIWALLVLLIGWFIAWIIALLVGKALRHTELDDKFVRWVSGRPDIGAGTPERWIARLVFWIIMVFVIIAFFQILGLAVIAEPLSRLLNEIFQYLPRLLAAILLILVAWVVAALARFVTRKLLDTTNLDERIGRSTTPETTGQQPISQSIAEAVYWLVLLLFLPAILEALGLRGLLQPVLALLNEFLSFLPNLVAAALILLVGWFIARIVQRIVTNLLVAIGTDEFGDRVGLTGILGKQHLSGIIGLIVYVLVLIPVLIAALNALQLAAITEPASAMLAIILNAIPAIFGAALLLVLAYLIAKVTASLVSALLSGIGFDNLIARMGLGKATTAGEPTYSEAVGYIVLVAIMLFATIEAADILNFGILAQLLTQLAIFGANVLLGIVIFAIGIYLANIAARAIDVSRMAYSGMLAFAARVSILILAGAMALRQIGVANDIILLAFGLLLGAIAIALAISFGLGGREVANRELKNWIDNVRRKG